MTTCSIQPQNRRRLFWSTQPDSCSTDDTSNNVCGFDCGRPGLKFTDTDGTSSISTDNWIRGLALNMLMTDARREDTNCGFTPGGQGGHWSESYMSGDRVGTLLRTIDSSGSVAQLRSLVAAYAKATLERLVTRGVATRVEVAAEYLGSGRFQLAAEIYGTENGTARVGLAAQRLTEGWVWE
jgi:phage gp46-like protein